jgi:acetyl esterase
MRLIEKLKINFIKKEIKKQRNKYQELPITGEKFIVPRNSLKGVEVILYRPQNTVMKSLPVFFNLHGGAWVGGDAALMDSFCNLMADNIPALIINVNYTKIDVQPFPYPQIELCDAVLYFSKNADQHGINKTKFAIGGYSAGAHIAAGAAIRLKELGFNLSCQMLVYPFLDFTKKDIEKNIEKQDRELIKVLELFRKTFLANIDLEHRWISPLLANNDYLKGIAPAIIITCGKDPLKPQGLAYVSRLKELGINVIYKKYTKAEHGFLEFSQPEYDGDERRSPKQFEMSKDCEQYLINELKTFLFKNDSGNNT